MVTDEQYWEFSRVFRDSLIAYGFKPVETRLLLILCAETFDSKRLWGRVDLTRWALRLKMREDKLRNGPWREVCELHVVDFNAGQGTYELRPDIGNWSMLKGTRVPTNLQAGPELPLVAERPVSEAYSELSRETVLTKAAASQGVQPGWPAQAGSQSSKDWGVEFKRLGAAIGNGTWEQEFPEPVTDKFSVNPLTENLSEGGGKIRRAAAEKSAATGPPQNQAVARTAEKSAAPIGSLVFLRKTSPIGPAEKSAAAFEWVRCLNPHALSMTNCKAQWVRLCRKDPDYVLQELAAWLQKGVAKARKEGKQMENPLSYIARIARNHGKLR